MKFIEIHVKYGIKYMIDKLEFARLYFLRKKPNSSPVSVLVP